MGFFSVDIVKCPFKKGTSNEEKIREVLESEILVVFLKEHPPREITLRLGRSNQSIIDHHTIQTQTLCSIE